MKNYEVLVTASAVVLVVGAKDAKQAMTFATFEAQRGTMQVTEAEIRKIVPAEDLSIARRLADFVSEEDEDN